MHAEGAPRNNLDILPCPLVCWRCRAFLTYSLKYAGERSPSQQPSVRRHNCRGYSSVRPYSLVSSGSHGDFLQGKTVTDSHFSNNWEIWEGWE